MTSLKYWSQDYYSLLSDINYKTEHLVTLLITIFVIIKLNIVHGNYEQFLAIDVFLTWATRRQHSVIREQSLGQAAYSISIALLWKTRCPTHMHQVSRKPKS